MNKYFLKLTATTLMLSTLMFLGCTKDEGSDNNNTTAVNIEQKNRALVIFITATWDGKSGAYGIAGFNDAIAKGKDKMVPFAIHSTDPLTVPAMTNIASMGRFMTNTVPRIVVGNGLAFPADVFSDVNLTGNQIVESSDTFITNNSVVAGVTLNNLKVDGSNISVDVHSKFFNTAVTGDYQIAVYFYENGILQNQKVAGQPDNPNQQHDHTIRAVATPTAWGESITVSGDVRTKTYTAPMNAAWKSQNMGAIAIIWKKITSSDYLYINGNIK